MSSPRSETEWVALLHGTFVHTTSPRVGIGPFDPSKCGTIPASRIAGYQWGRGGSESTLSVRLPCGHTGAFFTVLGWSSAGDRIETRMQDGTVTPRCSPGRIGSVGRTPSGYYSELGTGVHALQSLDLYV